MKLETQDAVLNFVEISKQGLLNQAASVVEMAKEGLINPLDAKIKIKALENLIKEIAKGIDSMAREEAEKYGKSFSHLGAKVELIEAGAKYDYENCGDPVYGDLVRQQAELSAKIKAREEILKANKAQWIYVDEETGESTTVLPAVKTSTSTIKVTFQ